VAALIEQHSSEMLAIIEKKLAFLMSAPVDIAVREVVRTMIEAHRVNPALHQALVEQIPRVGRLPRVEDVEARSLELISAYLEARRGEIRPKNLEIAAFILAHVVEAVAHGAVLRNPEYLVGEALIEETTDLVLRYLGQ
jgi:hypothetical protein